MKLEASTTKTVRSTGRDSVGDSTKPFRGRRISWREFYSLRPDLRPENDNGAEGEMSAPKCSPVPALNNCSALYTNPRRRVAISRRRPVFALNSACCAPSRARPVSGLPSAWAGNPVSVSSTAHVPAASCLSSYRCICVSAYCCRQSMQAATVSRISSAASRWTCSPCRPLVLSLAQPGQYASTISASEFSFARKPRRDGDGSEGGKPIARSADQRTSGPQNLR